VWGDCALNPLYLITMKHDMEVGQKTPLESLSWLEGLGILVILAN